MLFQCLSEKKVPSSTGFFVYSEYGLSFGTLLQLVDLQRLKILRSSEGANVDSILFR